MKWQKSWIVVALAWIATALPAPAQSPQDVLKNVPDDALGFAIVKNLAQADQKFQATAKRFKAPMAESLLEAVKKGIGVEKGLDEKGTLLVIALPDPRDKDEPIGLALVPVSDYDAFVKGLMGKGGDGIDELQGPDGTRMVAVKVGKHAVLTKSDHKDTLVRVTKKDIKQAKLDNIKDWLLENDAAVVVAPLGVKMLVAKVRESFDAAREQGALPPETERMLKGFVQGFDQFVKNVETDVTHLALAIRADAEGNLSLTKKAFFRPEGTFAKAGKKAAKAKGDPLAGLPNQPYMMAFGGAMPENLMKAMMTFSSDMIAMAAKEQKIPEENLKKLSNAYADMATGIRGMAMLLGVPKDKQPLFHSMYAVSRVDDAPAYLMRYEKALAVMSDVMKDIKLPGAMNYESKRTKIDGMPALIVTGDLGLGGQEDPFGFGEMFFGNDGKMTATMVAVDKNTILMQYAGPEAAEKLVERYKAKAKGLSTEKQTATTVGLLPKGTQWVMLLSFKGTAAMVDHVMQNVMPQAGMKVPPFPDSPPLGIGVGLTGSGLEINIVLPAPTQEAIGNYIRQLTHMLKAV